MASALGKGVQPPTLRKLLVTLGGILKYAVRKKLGEYNPVREIEKPKTRKRKHVNCYKPKEIRALINSARDQEFRTLFTIAVMSGMRQGEILGLYWSDIDWFNNQVHVRRTYNYSQFYEPKSETSVRSIDLGEQAISELKKWKVACPPTELNLVFPNNEGNPMHGKGALKREFKSALRRGGLRDIRFHDLRHTYASLLINQGEHPKYIQNQMGHASISITMDTYGHLMNSVNQDVVCPPIMGPYFMRVFKRPIRN